MSCLIYLFFTAQGYVQLDELYSLTSCSSTSSPSKSSRSVSSSPTSTLRTRARASSADESANKKINKTGNKESIEDWEISAPEILCNKKNIGKSFSRLLRPLERRSKDHLDPGLGDPGSFLGSSWDWQLKLLANFWFSISWEKSKTLLCFFQTNLLRSPSPRACNSDQNGLNGLNIEINCFCFWPIWSSFVNIWVSYKHHDSFLNARRQQLGIDYNCNSWLEFKMFKVLWKYV